MLGLGKLKKIEGACLMGETHGGYVDAKAAQSVLEVLTRILGIKLDMSKLEERAKEGEKFMKKMEKEVEKQREMAGGVARGDELTYIR